MTKKTLFTIFAFQLCISIVFAQPTVSSVNGNVIHNNTLTISGSGFGAKNPAPPLLWDNCISNPPLNTHYDAWLPTNSEQGSLYNMAYRTSGFRGINPPSSRMNYFLGGAHAISNHSETYLRGGNVGIGKNITSHSYFINYYYRIDPNFDGENHSAYGDNMKEIVLTNTEGSFYPDGWGAFGYAAWCISDVPDVNFRNLMRLERMPINPAHQDPPYGCGGNNLVYHNNPINGWIKMQWEGNYNYQFDGPQIVLTTYPDGAKTFQGHYGDGLTVSEYARGPWANYPKENDLKFIGLGGFARVERYNNGTNSFRYFAGVYIDNTRARVMLGNNQNYESCTIMEPQIPSSWNSNSITCTINLGAFTDSGTAYLFVFDANNNRNPTGFPISIGGGGGDNTPPNTPTGLRIVQ
jgi:hypothetical protein